MQNIIKAIFKIAPRWVGFYRNDLHRFTLILVPFSSFIDCTNKFQLTCQEQRSIWTTTSKQVIHSSQVNFFLTSTCCSNFNYISVNICRVLTLLKHAVLFEKCQIMPIMAENHVMLQKVMPPKNQFLINLHNTHQTHLVYMIKHIQTQCRSFFNLLKQCLSKTFSTLWTEKVAEKLTSIWVGSGLSGL